jgi:predicted RNA-binding protein with RPS1 domain
VHDPQDTTPELLKLLELAAKYPEIGPPLAELAFKIGKNELAERVLRLGLDGPTPGLEYFFVAANAARRAEKHDEVRAQVLAAVRAFAAAPDDKLANDDGPRLLHLVRLAFGTLMFDQKDVNADPAFGAALAESLGALEGRLGNDPFYRSMLAQALWYVDKEKSEAEWERAVALGEPELTWNARGTWYKEAEKDPERAEKAYREGIKVVPGNALLLHNVAQILVDRAGQPDRDVEQARRTLREAEELLRAALRDENARIRRHVHATRDRLVELRSSLPPRPPRERAHDEEAAPPAKEPQVGDVVTGHVRSLAPYGVFVALGGEYVGLLHKSEDDPQHEHKIGDELELKVIEVRPGDRPGRTRIGLSRRAMHTGTGAGTAAAPPPPAHAAPPPRRREKENTPPQEKFLTKGRVSLGDMLLAKLKEQQGQGK